MSSNSQQNDAEVLRHHTYDGIQEYDKRLPNWWLFTLYGAIVFSAVYWAYYHWSDHMVPGYVRVEQQIEEMQRAALSGGAMPTDIQLWKRSLDPEAVALGQKLYSENCVACHGANLEGGIGANLVDAEWNYGGKPTEIYTTIQMGILEKGMPTWGPVLGPARMADVTAFIISRNKTIQEPAEDSAP